VAAGAPPDVTDFYPALAGDLITQGRTSGRMGDRSTAMMLVEQVCMM
jgi:hypothetical protein